MILHLLVSRGSLFQVFNQLLQTTTRLLAIHLMYQLAPLFADPRLLSPVDNLCEGAVEFSIWQAVNVMLPSDGCSRSFVVIPILI